MKGNTALMYEWFNKAEHDLLNAQIILESGRDPLPLDTVCFHCQQTVEKYLKGFLTYHQVEFPKTHFLATLLDLCQKIEARFSELNDVMTLNVYAVEIRYPDDTVQLTLNDAVAAYELASKTKNFVTEHIGNIEIAENPSRVSS